MGILPIQGNTSGACGTQMSGGSALSSTTPPLFSGSDLAPKGAIVYDLSCDGYMFDWGDDGAYHSHERSTYSTSSQVSEKGKELLNNKEFMDKVVAIAKRIGCDFKDLLGVMRAESGLNPAAVNKSSGASGLIQFMPKTAQGLGTSVEAIRNMSAVEQLAYVEKYLVNAKRSAGFRDGQKLSAGQLYALVFLPARANREVLTTSDEAYYRCNSATDTNGDGKITRAEMDARAKHYNVDQYIPHEYLA